MRFPAVASLAALSVSLWAASAAAAGPAALDVRLNGPAAPDLVATIARLGEPSALAIPAGTNFSDFVRERCGRVDLAYVEAFLRENPGLDAANLDAIPGGTEYSFPACARSPEPASRVIRVGETIERLFRDLGMPIDARALEWARRSLLPNISLACLRGPTRVQSQGAAAPRRTCTQRGFAATENATQFMMANPNIDVRMLMPGSTTIVLPRESVWSTISLRRGVSAATALTELAQVARAAAGAPTAEVARASVATLIADTSVPEGSCAGTRPDWPFSVQELERILANNEHLRAINAPEHQPRLARILVLDTGLDNGFVGRAIPEANRGYAMSVGETSSPRIYPGVNFATRQSDGRAPNDLPNRLHGSEVGAVLLGGPWLEAARSRLNLPVRMTFGSLAASSPDGSYLSSRAIYEALRYARRNQIPIINGSVFATENRDDFINALPTAGSEVILITAAGNTGQPFENNDLSWPGALGGNPQNAGGGLIVTVGSHDADGRISSFSRRGREFIDLLAPGCFVPTFTIGDPDRSVAPVERSGTSFATPIVSLVAALLYAEGLSPPDIKARLIMSVDVDGALANSVYSRGRLNVRKALSVWQDVLQYYHGTPDARGAREIRWAEGTLVYPHRSVRICGNPALQSELRKLSIAGDSGESEASRYIYAWLRSTGGDPYEMTREERCEFPRLTGEDIVIRESGSNSETSIPLVDVIDYVANSMLPRR